MAETEHISNKKTFLFRIRKRWLKFLSSKMRKDSLENLILAGHIEGNRPPALQIGMIAKAQTLLKTIKDGKLWGTMIDHVLKGHGK